MFGWVVLSGWCGDGWVPGIAGEGGAEGGQDVAAVFADGVQTWTRPFWTAIVLEGGA